MEAVFNYPVDAQGRGRSGLLWQNFPDFESLVLGMSGQGYAVWDDFTNFVTATSGAAWINTVGSAGTVGPYGKAVANGGKGGIAWFYQPATNHACSEMQACGGYGSFYIDLLAQKYAVTPPLLGPAYTGAPPQAINFSNDLIFETRIALLWDNGSSLPTIPASNQGPTLTGDPHEFFVGLSANGGVTANNIISSAAPDAFAPAQDTIGFYVVTGTTGATAGQLNFGFQQGTQYPQTITNILQSPNAGGTAVSPFLNAFNNAIAAQTAASNLGASATQAAEIGMDYMWVNLGFRWFAATQTVQCYVNGIAVGGATVFPAAAIASATYNAAAKSVAWPNTATSGLGNTNAILNAGTTNFPISYLTPTIVTQTYNSAGAVKAHTLVDWVACAQAN